MLGRFCTIKSNEVLDLEQKHKANYTKKYALSCPEMNKILGEFVGNKLTISIGENDYAESRT